jgi:hypothetical protein
MLDPATFKVNRLVKRRLKGAMLLSGAAFRSGKAVRYAVIAYFKPSVPGGIDLPP